MLNKNMFFFVIFIFLTSSYLIAEDLNENSCKNLIKALDLNTGAYNKCLFEQVNEKFSVKELKGCQNHYLKEIERLSYVYKNICK